MYSQNMYDIKLNECISVFIEAWKESNAAHL